MNLTKIFETQKVLRERINYNEPDRFNKLVLALLVEVGECANEWRGFKFWSKDQEPRNVVKCISCLGEGKGYFSGEKWTGSKEMCMHCSGTGEDKSKNPLLEEYVDGLHFVLEIGLEIKTTIIPYCQQYEEDITEQFRTIYYHVGNMNHCNGFDTYEYIVSYYLGLGEMLGFTWEQIENAYFKKNKVNHQRQDSGY